MASGSFGSRICRSLARRGLAAGLLCSGFCKMMHEVLIKGSTAKGEGKVLKNPVCGRGLFDVVNVWTL